MSETQHTQGSWERKDRYPLDGYKREVFGGGRHIASVHTAFGVWDVNDANANLIAAAPDLLAALEAGAGCQLAVCKHNSMAAIWTVRRARKPAPPSPKRKGNTMTHWHIELTTR